MPYLNGEKVSNDEWRDAKTGHGIGWKDAFGWNDGAESPSEVMQADLEPIEEPEEAAPPKTRRDRGKQAQAEAALLAVTGLTIDLDEDDGTLDESAFTDLDDYTEREN